MEDIWTKTKKLKTKKCAEQFTFRWDLMDCSEITSQLKVVYSPIFYGGENNIKHKWYFELHPRPRPHSHDTGFFDMRLVLDNFGDSTKPIEERKVKLSYDATLMDQKSVPLKGVKKVVGVTEEYTAEYNATCTCIGDINLPSLVESNGDKLQIFCQFTIYNPAPELTIAHNEKSSLTTDLKSLLSSGLLSDVELGTDSNPKSKKFSAHKNILALRSPVFAKMFEVNMSESVTNTVVISDFNETIVEAMLKHIYGGTCENFVELARELLQVAEKYELVSLKEKCEAIISANLKVDNAVSTLQFASLYNAHELKQNAIKFINRHKDEVTNTEEFSTLSLEVVVELYKAVSS